MQLLTIWARHLLVLLMMHLQFSGMVDAVISLNDYRYNDQNTESLSNCAGKADKIGYKNCPTQSCTDNSQCLRRHPRSRCVCDSELCGSVCVQLDSGCRYLSELQHGIKRRQNPDWNENAAGQTVKFQCQSGYRLQGERQIVCQANEEWSSTAPMCVPEDSELCSRPKSIPHTIMEPRVDKMHYNAGDEFVYSCAPGYRADTPGLKVTAICTKGVWSMHDIMCSIISCGHPGNLFNGQRLNSNFTFGQKVTFFCNEGFNISCSQPSTSSKKNCQVRTCQANGHWSGSTPICKAIKCPMLQAPEHGRVSSAWNTVNSVVQYSCDDGYRLVGKRSRMCRRDGKWDGKKATCEIQDCGPPPSVPNAYKPVYRSTKYEAKATYTCMPDTKFEGENGGKIICQKSGAWYPPPPRCRSHCRVPVIDLGKPLVGKFDGPEAKGKVPSDTTLWIRCHDNYRLQRVFYPRCDNGTWTKIPKCVPKDCEDRPPLINKGIARFYGTSHGDRVDYKCYVGYEIVTGSSSLVCRYGKWIGQAPKCSRKQCPWIPSDAGIQKWLIGVKGAKNPWTRPETRANHEEIVSFKCSTKGFILKGHTHSICINGQWRPAGSPKCVRQMHKQIPDDWLFYRTG